MTGLGTDQLWVSEGQGGVGDGSRFLDRVTGWSHKQKLRTQRRKRSRFEGRYVPSHGQMEFEVLLGVWAWRV